MPFVFEPINIDDIPGPARKSSDRSAEVLEEMQKFIDGPNEGIVLKEFPEGKPLNKPGTRAGLAGEINALAREHGLKVRASHLDEKVFLQKADPPKARVPKSSSNGA